VLRKIKQAKKALATAAADSAEFAALAEALLEARIDLYYILTYPKTDKYIALFPDGVFVPHSPPVSPATPASTSRDTLRQAVKARMASGALGAEPEDGSLEIEGVESVGASGVGEKRVSGEEEEEEAVAEEERPAKKSRGEAIAPSASAPAAKVSSMQAFSPTEGVWKLTDAASFLADVAQAAPAPGPPTEADAPTRKLGKKDRKARKQAEAEAVAVKEKESATGWAADGDDFFA